MKPSPLGLTALPVPGNRGLRLRTCAVKQETREAQAAQGSGRKEEIYIGFPKGDYDRTPGRKGRVVKDDPAKYPGRESLGGLPSVVGGWAGGEVGLWELRDQVLEEKAKKPQGAGTKKVMAPSSPIRTPTKNKWGVKTAPASGRDPIYVGFSKEELDLKKTGVQGRVIFDEAYRYPDKEDIGALRGVVGGFAGGEAALKAFAETGELKLRKPGDPTVKKQFSPLTLAFLVIFAAAGGGILLTSAFNLGDAGVQEIVQVTGQ